MKLSSVDELRMNAIITEMARINKRLEDLKDARELDLSRNKIYRLYPPKSAFSIEKYKKHKAFYSFKTRQAIFIAGNRCGKTFSGAFMMACHLIGWYPDWWEGRKFKRHIDAWAAGRSNETTRDIIQKELFGEVTLDDRGRKWVTGTGMIPYDNIVQINWKSGFGYLIDFAKIRSANGKLSQISFKACEQGRKSFEGTKKDVVWYDEEPDMGVYTEGVARTITTKTIDATSLEELDKIDTTASSDDEERGVVFLTFTPLEGVTEVVKSFCPSGAVVEGEFGNKTVVSMTWYDAPHIHQSEIESMLEDYPHWQRDARSKGIPLLGVGAVYDISEKMFVIEPREIPNNWPRFYGMDVGYQKTAVVWFAYDVDTDTMYVYAEYGQGHVDTAIHAMSVKAKGDWISGVVDPASRGRSQIDGQRLIDIYTDMGLDLSPADNAVESGIKEVYSRLSQGRLKIFNTCTELLAEYRTYKFDVNKHGVHHIVKANDHYLDGLRYGVKSGKEVMKYPPALTKQMAGKGRSFNYRPF
ncbi:large terminase protein [Caudoviricetes sp.]|nr:large terminase protein [Caudoviricetes sp.]